MNIFFRNTCSTKIICVFFFHIFREPDPEARINKELKSVAEEDALRKLLTSDEEEEEEKKSEESEKEDDENKKKEQKDNKENKDKKKKKLKKKGKDDKKGKQKFKTYFPHIVHNSYQYFLLLSHRFFK